MPTSEWKAATSSGIDVIGTRRAITAPMPPPSAIPSTTRTQAPSPAGGCAASVVAIAIAMPIMPNMLPRRLEAGLDRPRSARMKRTPATRYSTASRLAFTAAGSLFLLLVHGQHALGDQEAAEDIDRGKHQRDEPERARPDRPGIIAHQRDPDGEQRSDH